MSKGDAEHAAQHQHGVRYGGEPLAPQTVEQRVAKLEQGVPAPTGILEMIEAMKAQIAALETRVAELVTDRDERAAQAKSKKDKAA